MSRSQRPATRDAQATAQHILIVAQEVFHDRGFDGASTREIAERAELNLALINRYFGSKRALFQDAVADSLRFEALDGVQRQDLCAQLIAEFGAAPTTDQLFDPLTATLKSVANDDVRPMLIDALTRHLLGPISRLLSGPDIEARTLLIASQVLGLALMQRVLGHDLGEAAHVGLDHRLGRALDRLIDED
ncbi:MAG: TetR family transcriptional regulator [Burkholderiaceae bacterium]